MVISHKYKYLFIENGQTGCTAIRKELIENYDGVPILRKHSIYSEFLNIASEEEKEYFVFITVRNPLDKAVSSYLKYKNDHRNRYTDRINLRGRQAIIDLRHLYHYKNISKKNYSFKDYLASNKWLPYDDMSTLKFSKDIRTIKFENLNNDFQQVLQEIGIEPIRDLPKYNSTESKSHYLDFYTDDVVKKIAFQKFGVFMKYWDYQWPKTWPKYNISNYEKIKWNFFHSIRKYTWGEFRKGLKDA
ncbi:sulfotransferase family 2 domain-containing protein [Namhaeicola litoreus]|uniref:Sulfotransferase family 2 domain-containing protein n=1 Tax=Namhaeicola litoreus TaxID=1052145 RepID=A0ABW3Y4N9_9FLAO